MNDKLALVVGILKKVLIWGVLPIGFVVFCFILGEQFEVGRLSAIASCEGSINTASCIRSKGYLANAPYYPDLGRRYFGGFARMIGGDLGASYKVEEKLQAVTIKPVDPDAADDEPEDEDKKSAASKKDAAAKKR